MTQRVTTVLAAALVAAVFVCGAQAGTPEEEIRQAILRLGAEEQELRDAAQALLQEIGPETVLLYRPEDQGKDPEINRRMGELLSGWEYETSAAAAGLPGRGLRIPPWIDVGEALAGPRAIEDDRVPEALLSRLRKATLADLACMMQPDVPLSSALVRAGIESQAHALPALLAAREDLVLPEDARSVLVDFLRQDARRSDECAAFVLFRLGDRAPFLERLRTGGKELPRVFDFASDDPDVRVAVAEGYAKTPELGRAAARFPSAAFTRHFAETRDIRSLSRLDPAVATPVLRELLRDKEKTIRVRAAIALAGFGESSADLTGWTDAEVWKALDGDSTAVARAATLLPGERVEERLRDLADHPSLDPEARYAALRGLAARRRERDITFIYTHLKDLDAEFQPEVAVDLARLGSAAGANVLIPRLYGTGYTLRRDANNALKKITGQDFGYNPAGTLPERCRAARRWAIWWRENRTSFHPDVK